MENGKALLVALMISGRDGDFTFEKNDHTITHASFLDQEGAWITVLD
jgi:hypothetical protein